MNAPFPTGAAKSRLVMILTRSPDDQKMAGRLKILIAIRAIFRQSEPAMREVVLRSLVETRSVLPLLGAIATTLRFGVMGRWLPLQCILYADRFQIARLCDAIGPEVEHAYLDGIRCYPFLRELRRRRPDLHVVVDFDDLMSRRMDLLLTGDRLPSAGHLSGAVPGLLNRVLKTRAFARIILRYERGTLVAAERHVTKLADAVVLLSSTDAANLIADSNTPKVHVIPPTVQVHSPAKPRDPRPIRFVFIGTDKLRQNQLTIDQLLALWAVHGLTSPLVIFGEQERRPVLPAAVSVPGYVSSLEEVYDGRTILLSPSYLGGGIKTKVLEAFAYGVPVIGNSLTFESLPIQDYPLIIDDEAELVALLSAPEQHRDRFDRAASLGAVYIKAHHDPRTLARQWRKIMALDEPASG